MRDCKTFMVCAVILIAAMYVISTGPASASENSKISAVYEACEAEADGGTSGVEIATISSPRAKVDRFTNNRCGIRYEPWLHAVIGNEMYEQAASEETDVCDESSVPESHRRMDVPQTTCPETVESPCELAVEESVLVLSETTPEPIPEMTPRDKLLTALTEAGIEFFWPYACAQMMQESGGNPYAVSPDGKDHGLFQFRAQYWTEPESIYDVDAQIRVYVSRVAARINAGLSIEEIISRHYTSDYITDIAWDYVNAVLQWVR